VQPMVACHSGFCGDHATTTVGFDPRTSHTAVRHVTDRPLQLALMFRTVLKTSKLLISK